MWLRIGLFTESFPPVIDGVSNAVLNYAGIIQQNHGESIVVMPQYKGVCDAYPFKVIRYDSVGLPANLSYRAGNPFDFKTVKKLRKQHFDLIHIHSPFASSILASLLVRKKEIPIVVTYHTKFDIDFEERFDIPLFQKIALNFVLSNIKAADEVWAVSKGAGESLRQIGYDGEYYVMENGTDFPRGISSQEAQDALFVKRYGISRSELVFIYVGRMMWYKNIKLIIDTLMLVKDRGITYKMFFVGDGLELDEIKQYVSHSGIENQVVFTGAIADREELRKYYSRADLFLFPSTFDTSGIVVKEAAACDCPSLLTQGSCAAEDVEDGKNGFLAEENPESMCKRIQEAVADREQLQKVGKAAGEQIYLSWEDAVAKAYARYEILVSRWRTKGKKHFWNKLFLNKNKGKA